MIMLPLHNLERNSDFRACTIRPRYLRSCERGVEIEQEIKAQQLTVVSENCTLEV